MNPIGSEHPDKQNGRPSGLRILAVDDEKSILELYVQLLAPMKEDGGLLSEAVVLSGTVFEGEWSESEQAPFELIVCSQGDEAVQLVREAVQGGKPFAVVFLDVRMPPGPDGIWAAERIREIDPDVEIVIVTGFSDVHPKEIVRRVPPSHKLVYVQKPFNLAEIYQLASALSAKLKQECALRKAHTVLERMVEQRTIELSRANEKLQQEIRERRSIECALRESEEKFRSISGGALDGIMMIDAEGKISFWNKAAEAMFGYSPEEALGRELHLLLAPEIYHESYYTAFSAFKETGEGPAVGKTLELSALKKNGEEFPVEISISSLKLRGKWHAVGVVRDVTDRKRGEEALRESEEKFRKFSDEASLDGIIIHERGRILYVSEPFAKMYGYTREELIGLDPVDTIAPESRRVLLRHVRQGGEESYDVLAKRKDGSTFPIEVHPRNLLLGGRRVRTVVVRDLTERRQAEQALRESEARFRSIVEHSHDGIIIVDDAFKLIYVNEELCRIIDYKPAEVIGKDFRTFVDEADRRMAVRYYVKGQRGTQDAPSRFEIKLVRRGGEKRTVEVSASIVKDSAGNVQTVAQILDVTERKQAEEEKAGLEAQLQQSQKMEAVGTLASGIAHDFNNILQAISGYVQMASASKAEFEGSGEYLEQIDRAVGRASDLVRRLLTFGRRIEPVLKPMDLNLSVIQAVEMLKRTIPKMIRIETMLAEDLRPINGDVTQLQQLLLNLGANASDAMPKGGTLAFSTENISPERDSDRTDTQSGTGWYVRIKVSDTGQGMRPETLKHAFEPFYSTKEVGKGTGLGLSTVYGIVKNHGGEITCESELYRGTTFFIRLPVLKDADVQHAEEEEVFEKHVVGGDETILVADDEKDLVEVARQFLERYGYSVIDVSSGEEALEYYRERGNNIDLVVMDLGMPGMGGLRALDRMMAVDPKAKVLVASGYTADEWKRKCAEAGALEFIDKPYRFKDLLKKIRTALDRR
ncbi:MAG: PAS domain S-box protein [Deltaproteobacteria bacterium]|nr:PAS domain S-box protein [Deltaproteobacteria bacterium]